MVQKIYNWQILVAKDGPPAWGWVVGNTSSLLKTNLWNFTQCLGIDGLLQTWYEPLDSI